MNLNLLLILNEYPFKNFQTSSFPYKSPSFPLLQSYWVYSDVSNSF
jgi:hypothetical protein